MGKHSRCYQEIKNTETTPDIVTVCEIEITDNVQCNQQLFHTYWTATCK